MLSQQRVLAALAEHARSLDIRTFEPMGSAELRRELWPFAFDVVARGCAQTHALLDACEELHTGQTGEHASPVEPLLPFERAIDAVVAIGEASVSAVEDVAFLVQIELRQRRARLERLSESSSALSILGECDGALRRVRKGLGALDLALARAAETSPLLDFSSELEESLQVRAAYAKLRARLSRTAPSDTELRARMRAAGTAIAILVGWRAYPLLRARDRLQLRELQQRILEWLRTEGPEDGVAGQRLWQDIVGFAEMLSLVNRRQELVEHDTQLVSALLAELPADDDAPLAPALLLRARRLEGADCELDEVIGARAGASAPALRAALERLRGRLGPVPETGR